MHRKNVCVLGRVRRGVMSTPFWAISAYEYTTSASLATRATNWVKMTATSCARTHLLAPSLLVSPSLVNVRIEIVGAAAVAIVFRIAAGNAVYTVCQGSGPHRLQRLHFSLDEIRGCFVIVFTLASC